MAALFVISALLLIYTYAGYPLVLWALARVRPRPVRKAGMEALPSVTVVIVGHNEAHRLAAKLDTCLSLRYPADRLQVMFASDGSTDDTPAVVSAYAHRGVRLLEFATRRGKSACLNDAAAACTTDLILFTDARQRLHSDALQLLVANFADPEVGAASGELVFVQDDLTAFAEGVDAYWRYEKFIREHESLTGSVVGVTGALYAMRRECFRPIPAQTLLDDVAIPMQAAMEGWRIVFEKGAIAYDKPSAEPAQEKIRKVRTLAGNFQLLALLPGLMSPARNPLFWRFISHKMLRLLAPVLMLTALVSHLMLVSGSPLMAWLLLPHLGFYTSALLPQLWPQANRVKPIKIAAAFLHLNWFVVLGLINYVRTKDVNHIWKQGASAGTRSADAVEAGERR